jgi:endonuclease YncB( thermonuclease family)
MLNRRSILAAAAMLIAAAAMSFLAFETGQRAEASTADAVTVYWSDGDSGRLSDGTRFRLHGIDAPETGPMGRRGGAKCEAERALGYEAKAAALEITRGRDVTILEDRGSDRYGRAVLRLAVDGTDLNGLLIAAGTHQVWDYDRRQPKPDWCGPGAAASALRLASPP